MCTKYMDNKNIGSLRCKACGIELRDDEIDLCTECDSRSLIDSDIIDLEKALNKQYS